MAIYFTDDVNYNIYCPKFHNNVSNFLGPKDAVNAFIAEFSPTGSLLWGTYFGGGNTYAEAISIDKFQNLSIVGLTETTPNLPLPSPNASGAYFSSVQSGGDGFIAVFNNAKYVWGTYWTQTILYSIADFNGQNLYVSGTTGSSLILQQGPSVNSWYEDPSATSSSWSYISEFGLSPIIVAGVNNIENPNNGVVTVFPNPSSESFTVQISLPKEEDVELTLFNMLGQAVYFQNYKDCTGTINKQIFVSLLDNGPYILKVRAGEDIYTKKIIKQY